MLDGGVSYAEKHEGLHRRAPHYDARIWGLTMNRERLYARIDARVDQMMVAGLIDEVRHLVDEGLSTSLTAGQAIGYKEVIDLLEGRIDKDEAVEVIKRQLSWLRRDGRTRWVDLDRMSPEEAADLIVEDAQGQAESFQSNLHATIPYPKRKE